MDRLDGKEQAAEALKRWRRVFDGLSEEEISEVEAIALARSRFRKSLDPGAGSA